LLRGGEVCSQLCLAVLFSSVLTLTTAPAKLAAAAGWFMAPLTRFRFPVEEIIALLLLALHFIPILREEAAQAADKVRAEASTRRLGRLRFVERMIAPLVSSLVERADAMALALARGDDDVISLLRPLPFPSLGIVDGLVVLGGGVSLLVFFGWLR
jgi:energy-coupling factor transport system permease protein